MSFDWKAFLDFARSLYDHHGEEEPALRSAISRAYYAAFHYAKTYIRRVDPSIRLFDDGRDHEEVPKRLKAMGRSRVEIGAGMKLEKLKRLRTWADYQRNIKDRLRDNVQQALRDAEAIVTHLGDPEPQDPTTRQEHDSAP